ncbi:MAG: hypothetical protein OSJ58_21765, partial [Dysosmobacter sp.]|nr:hypothetical protein [Dysosmobacter sp.]
AAAGGPAGGPGDGEGGRLLLPADEIALLARAETPGPSFGDSTKDTEKIYEKRRKNYLTIFSGYGTISKLARRLPSGVLRRELR